MADGIAELRSFNRFYTQRIGVLTDRYLGQDRPLAEARLLFEIGSDGARVHALRERLGLDSGYLSRMLRSLERSGLVETVAAGGPDARRKLARPTPAGQAELAEINRRSDAAMARVVDGLDEPQVQELVAALATLERLLGHDASERAGRPVIRRAQAGDAAAIAGVLRRAFAEQEPAFTPDAFAVSTPDPATLAGADRDRSRVGRGTGPDVWSAPSAPYRGRHHCSCAASPCSPRPVDRVSRTCCWPRPSAAPAGSASTGSSSTPHRSRARLRVSTSGSGSGRATATTSTARR